MLYREQTFAPRAFHSELQQQTNTVRKARLEPAIRDAQKLAQNVFPPWRGDARLARFLLPAFPCAQIFIAREEKREKDVWVGGRGHSVSKKNQPLRVLFSGQTGYCIWQWHFRALNKCLRCNRKSKRLQNNTLILWVLLSSLNSQTQENTQS